MAMMDEVWQAVPSDNQPTFFEFVSAMALLFFKRQEASISVIETGLGGRLDSTNVIKPLVTGITNINLEHTEHLGPDIISIAKEKAGIIKEGCPFVGGNLSTAALEVIKEKLNEFGGNGKFLGQEYDYTLRSIDNNGSPTIDYYGPCWRLSEVRINLPGAHQAENGAMALALAESLTALSFDLDQVKVKKAMADVSWPGRGEYFQPGQWPPDRTGKCPLMLDGAHNPAGAKALSGFLSQIKQNNIHLIVGVMADKDIFGVLEPLIPRANRLYLTRPTYHRAATPEMLLDKIVKAQGKPSCFTGLYSNLPEAIKAAAIEALSDDLVVVSGSLFTVGEARAYLKGLSEVESN
jgi:dihydrofolate synthase/folylpolyglutamate synthase